MPCVAGAVLALGGCAATPPPVDPPALGRVPSDVSLHTLWYRQPQHTRPAEYTQPGALLHEGHLYHADRPDRVIAFDAAAGKELWRTVLRPADDPKQGVHLNTGLGAGAGLVFAGTRQGRLFAIDPADGRVRWEAQLASEVAAPPVAEGRYVIARSNDGRIYGLEASTGRQLWVQVGVVPPLSLRGAGRPVIDEGQVYIGLANGRLIAVSIATGEVVWETAVGIPEGRSEFERLVDVDADPAISGSTVFAAAYQARLAAVSTVSGRIQWSRELSTHQPLLLVDGLLYVSTEGANVMAVDSENGAILWRQSGLAGRWITGPVWFADTLLVADSQGFVHGLSPEDGRFVSRHRVSSDPILATPIAAADVLYVVDASGALQALRRVEGGS